MKAQMGLPDMKLPIQYALGYPSRLPSDFPRFDFIAYPSLTFEAPHRGTFRCLEIAYEAMRRGGNVACVMNAANEIAVEAFLNNKIRFHEIPTIIEGVVERVDFEATPTLDNLLYSDNESRILARELCGTSE